MKAERLSARATLDAESVLKETMVSNSVESGSVVASSELKDLASDLGLESVSFADTNLVASALVAESTRLKYLETTSSNSASEPEASLDTNSVASKVLVAH